MKKRKSISKKTRFEVFKRDGFICQYCGNYPPKVILEADHVIPVKTGGSDLIDNLICSCFDCNRGKGARLLSSVPKTVKAKAKRMREAEDQINAFNDLVLEKASRIEEEAWSVVHIYDSALTNYPAKDFRSVEKFIELIGLSDTREAMTIAANREKSPYQTFKYFCGICWNFHKGEKYA